jgi:hypothetical protein
MECLVFMKGDSMEVSTQYSKDYYAGYRSDSGKTVAGSFAFSLDNDDENIAAQAASESTAEALTTEELYYQQANVIKITQQEAAQEQTKKIGVGFLFVDNVGLGMTASQILNGDSDKIVVRVQVTSGETYDVDLSEVDPSNASAIEMFAFCEYADANGTGVDDTWGSWHALKEFSTSFGESLEYPSVDAAVSEKTDWTKALSESKYTITKESTGETMSAADVFKMLKETLVEAHKLTAEKAKKTDDWREMDDAQWDKLIESIDNYLDDFKEELEHMEEVMEEAARKATADAPADMRAAAASKAMLKVMANGIAGEENDTDVSDLEKMSWMYNLETDDQVILATAKMATETASDAMSKAQEIALTGDTTEGISETGGVTECASSELNEDNRKTWTITAFTEQGIVSKKCVDGVVTQQWEINYKNPGDYKRVTDFLAGFDEDTDWKFAGSKEFWEDFLGYID